MFLELLAENNLLQHSINTDILHYLPLEPKAAVLTTLFQELIDNKENTTKLISSISHLNFFYEILGAAFALPLSHSALTLKAFEIYKSWIPICAAICNVSSGHKEHCTSPICAFRKKNIQIRD